MRRSLDPLSPFSLPIRQTECFSIRHKKLSFHSETHSSPKLETNQNNKKISRGFYPHYTTAIYISTISKSHCSHATNVFRGLNKTTIRHSTLPACDFPHSIPTDTNGRCHTQSAVNPPIERKEKLSFPFPILSPLPTQCLVFSLTRPLRAAARRW